MPPFFSRDTQISKLKTYVDKLQSSASRGLILFGPKGAGKSASIDHFLKTLQSSNDPVIWMLLKPGSSVGNASNFLASSTADIGTNWPELEPYISAFQTDEGRLERDDENSSEDEWGRLLADTLIDYFWQPETQDTHPELNDLKLLMIIDDWEEAGVEFSSALGKLYQAFKQNEMLEKKMGWIFASADKATGFQRMESNALSTMDFEEVLLPPFSQSESNLFLQSQGVNPKEFDTVFRETGGMPAALVEFCGSRSRISKEQSGDIERAEEILSTLSVEQREWMKSVALLGNADEEGLNVFLSNDQCRLALNWLSNVSIPMLNKGGEGYFLEDREREIILTWMKHDNPKTFARKTEKARSLESVRRAIPRYEFRHLLSLLSPFEWFNREILELAYGAETSKRILSLVDRKQIYFVDFYGNHALASNVKLIVRLYNQLIPPKDLSSVRDKVRKHWSDKNQQLKRDIEEHKKQIEVCDQVVLDTSKSIERMDQTIKQSAESLSKLERECKDYEILQKKHKTNWWPILMQIAGIVTLYIAVLMKDQIIWPILLAAALLVTVGFIYSLKSGSKKKVRHLAVRSNVASRNRLKASLEKMRTNQLALAARRDNARSEIIGHREKIESISTLMKRPCMTDI
ncbi:MAG: AAA family ATPase [Opitutales bacterium]|nr:AAA family ATPase [Opitutales bacterium]